MTQQETGRLETAVYGVYEYLWIMPVTSVFTGESYGGNGPDWNLKKRQEGDGQQFEKEFLEACAHQNQVSRSQYAGSCYFAQGHLWKQPS